MNQLVVVNQYLYPELAVKYLKVMTDLSIIIVSYKSKEHLKVLLPSIWQSQVNFNYDVIVVDNGSDDQTKDLFDQPANKKAVFIQNTNTGFARGNNLGILKSKGKYVLLLNPDTQLQPQTLQIMFDFLESHPEVGMAGPKIVKPDGQLDLAARRRFPNLSNSFKRLFLLNNKNYNYSDISENQEMEVDSIVGAFMMVRKSVIEKIGLLDEDFFMYGEDLDWCFRCKAAGFKVWYYPKTFITHFKGASSRKAPYKMLKSFHDAMWIFYSKHYRSQNNFLINTAVWFGIKLRLLLLLTLNFFKRSPKVSK